MLQATQMTKAVQYIFYFGCQLYPKIHCMANPGIRFTTSTVSDKQE